MDNPQGSWTAPWIAGLWLADGHFGVNPHWGKKNQYIRPNISLVGCDLPHMQKAYEVLRANGIGAYFRTTPKPYGGQKQPNHRVEIHGWVRSHKFVGFVLPYLVGRKRLLALLIREIASQTIRDSYHRSDSDKEFRIWAVKTAKALNAHGGMEPSEIIITAPPYDWGDEGMIQALIERQGLT